MDMLFPIRQLCTLYSSWNANHISEINCNLKIPGCRESNAVHPTFGRG